MRNLELIEQSSNDYIEIKDLEVDEWHAAVHQQEKLGLDFNQELAQGEKAWDAGRVNEAFIHLHAAESKLASGGEWDRRERWLYAAARLYQAADRTDEMLAVYRMVLQMAWDTLGEDHPLPRRLQSSLNELAWSHATDQAERLQALVDSIEEAVRSYRPPGPCLVPAHWQIYMPTGISKPVAFSNSSVALLKVAQTSKYAANVARSSCIKRSSLCSRGASLRHSFFASLLRNAGARTTRAGFFGSGSLSFLVRLPA
jgi:hypothetical protein